MLFVRLLESYVLEHCSRGLLEISASKNVVFAGFTQAYSTMFTQCLHKLIVQCRLDDLRYSLLPPLLELLFKGDLRDGLLLHFLF